MDLPDVKNMIREIVIPEEANLNRAAECLTKRGWIKDIAGEENFGRGVKAMAYAAVNHLGIFVTGEPGTGKTRYLEAVTEPLRLRRQLCIYRLKDPCDADRLNRFDYPDAYDEALTMDVFIDDLGAEARINHYGLVFEPVMDFIFAYMTRGNGRLFINSNLRGEALLERYTARIDQLKEFVIPLHFTGKGVRQWMLPL